MNRTMTLIRYLCPSALAALWLALAPPAAAQGAAPASGGSRITAIKLYPGSATVQRTLRLAAGARQALFACLPPGLDATSLQLSADAGVRVGELALRQQPRELLGPACASALDERIRTLEDRIAALAAETGGIDIATGYLKNFGAGGEPGRGTPAGQIGATAQALQQGGQTALLRRHQLARQQEQLERELKPLLAERDRASRGDQPVSTVQVTLWAPQGGELRLSYQVRGPGWQPAYRASLDSASRQLRLERLAQVAQSSGEDWSEVPLTLSTGQPGAATQGPLPRPWRIGIEPPPAAGEARQRLAAAPAPVPVAAAAKAPEAEPSFDVSVFQGSFATEFVLPQRVSVPSSGERITLTLGEQVLDTRLRVRTTPALDAHAYLIASFTTPAGVWPAGPLHLVRDGAFVGSARFDAASASRDGLAFGRDELVGVRVERPEQQQGTGGFIGSRHQRIDSRRYVIDNRHREPIVLELLDSAPVGEHADVRIESRYQPAPQTERWNEQKGVVAWEQSLAAGASQSFSAEHVISWPSDAHLRERR